jgi:hypothetical protein
MSQTDIIKVRKVTGEVVDFSIDKLKESLSHSGANQETIERIVNKILRNVYDTISSHEIYKMAFDQLREIRSIYASKYRLKKAIYELGPSGFPFERLVAKIFEKKGYSAEIGNIITGKCVSHEIDVLLHKKKKYAMVECKFHSDDKYICNIKIPLYIHSRFNDLKKNWKKGDVLKNVWIVTNTRFSEEAIHYAKCNNIKLLSWNYPKDNGLKKRINDLGIYPLTTLSLLSGEEKNQLLDQNVVLCSELYKNHYLLNKIGVSKNRKQKIIDEIEELCSIHYTKK